MSRSSNVVWPDNSGHVLERICKLCCTVERSILIRQLTKACNGSGFFVGNLKWLVTWLLGFGHGGRYCFSLVGFHWTRFFVYSWPYWTLIKFRRIKICTFLWQRFLSRRVVCIHLHSLCKVVILTPAICHQPCATVHLNLLLLHSVAMVTNALGESPFVCGGKGGHLEYVVGATIT